MLSCQPQPIEHGAMTILKDMEVKYYLIVESRCKY